MPFPADGENRNVARGLQIAVVLLAISAFLNYVDRGNLSIAAPLLKEELGMSEGQLGMLLAAFFCTYTGAQLISGWLVDRLNVNWVFAGGFLVWSAATAVTGLARTFAALVVIRLVLGLGESVAYPSYSKILALGIPEERRGVANAALTAGLLLGPGAGMLFGGLLMGRFGWRPFFLGLGLASLLWLVPWMIWMPKQRAMEERKESAPRLSEFLLLRSAWGTCIGLFCMNYLSYFLVTWLPYYLVKGRGYSMEEMAKLGGAAYLSGAACAMAAGWASDRWIRAGGTPTLVRKTFTAGGLALAGLAMVLAGLGGGVWLKAGVMLGVIFFGVSGANVWGISQTLAGARAAGRWVGFQNFVGNFSGIAAPALTGYILQRMGHFQWAFGVTCVVALVGTAAWLLLVGRIEPVQWGGARDQAEGGTPRS